jgi:ribonucleoside-diphosphate reductase alpha chain
MTQTNPSDLNAEDVVLPVKRVVGETLEDRMTANAYERILPSRYLKKDAENNIIETQEELFARVAQNVAFAEVAYLDETVMVSPADIKKRHSRPEELIAEVFGMNVSADDDVEVELDEFNVNKFDFDAVYAKLSDEGKAHVDSVVATFEDLMTYLSFTPNSPTLMNAGEELQQLSACFVNSPGDDIADIHNTLREAAEVFQSGGGMGYAFYGLRPYGDPVGSTGGIASGPISFMRTFDTMCETIAQGGKRRGAQMAVFRVDHPDVIEFIHSKNKDVSLAHSLRLNDPDDYTHTKFIDALNEARDLIDENGRVPFHLRNAVEGHLSNFNISVGVTDAFMDALYNDEEFVFINPVTEKPHIVTPESKELYEQFDLGQYLTVGEEMSIPAAELWERIVEGAWENGEPGIIYLDRVNQMHSFDVEEHPEYKVLATNPCGEQPLMEYEACNLGHINLSTVISENADSFQNWNQFEVEHADEFDSLEEMVEAFLMEALDMDEFNHRIDWGTHFLENVVTMSDFPIPEIERSVYENRKIGLGIMGLAQMYLQLGVKYGSDAGNEMARQVMRHINHRSKLASHWLAEARGPFANWEDSKYADPTAHAEWFEMMTGEDAADWEDGFPVRNHNTTTIAPTGTTSMIANTSGGCEPIFNVAYFKNVSDDVQGDEMLVEFDDYFLRVLEANNIDVEAVKREAHDQMSNNEFTGVAGLSTVPDAINDLFVVSSDLRGIEHASVQCACQEGVDSAISKTCNFPNSASREDMDEVYRYIYDNGGKGVTVYRDGTRSKQVLTTRADNADFADEDDALEAIRAFVDASEENVEAVSDLLGEFGASTQEAETAQLPSFAEKRERPDALTGVTQRIPTGYGKLYVHINKDTDGQPFEMFANIGSSGGFTNGFTEALAKSISVALRSGVDPREIASELRGTRSPKVTWDRGEQVNSIPDAMGIALLRYLNGTIHYSDEQIEALESPVVVEQEVDETPKNGDDATQALIDNGEAPECPECGSMTLYYSEGCKSCESCGWSEC